MKFLGTLIFFGFFLVIVSNFSACVPYAHSPPVKPVIVDTPYSTPPGTLAVSGGIYIAHGNSIENIKGYNVTVKTGITENTEISLSGYHHLVTPYEEENIDSIDGNIFNAFAGIKANPTAIKRWLSFSLGAGGGKSNAGGNFIGLNTGIHFGFENKYFVPFANFSTDWSYPFKSKEIDFSGDDAQDDITTHKPMRSFAFSMSLGFKIPVTFVKSPHKFGVNFLVLLPQMTVLKYLEEDNFNLLEEESHFDKVVTFRVIGLWLEFVVGIKSQEKI